MKDTKTQGCILFVTELKLSALKGGAFRHGVSFILFPFLPAPYHARLRACRSQGLRPEWRGLRGTLRSKYTPNFQGDKKPYLLTNKNLPVILTILSVNVSAILAWFVRGLRIGGSLFHPRQSPAPCLLTSFSILRHEQVVS